MSELGEVRNVSTKRIRVAGYRSDSGYLRVQIERKLVRLHRLVLTAHAGPPPSPRHVCAHVNGDKDDCRLENLEWKVPEGLDGNEADKRRHGTARGHGARPVVELRAVEAIRAAVAAGESIQKAATRFGVHRSSASRYVRGLRRTG